MKNYYAEGLVLLFFRVFFLKKEVCLQSNVISLCLSQLEEPNPLLEQWLAICLGKLWCKYDAAKWCGVRDSAHKKLQSLLWHDIPDVSAILFLT